MRKFGIDGAGNDGGVELLELFNAIGEGDDFGRTYKSELSLLYTSKISPTDPIQWIKEQNKVLALVVTV
jgi:hypothetical protein